MKKGWKVERLGDVCETGAGGTPLKSHKDYYEGGTIPWLLSGEVGQGEIFEATNFITEKGLQNSSARLFPPNTVLIAMYGATAGQVGILRFASTTNQAVCGILPNDKFLPEFLYYCFLAKKDELISQAVGGAQPNISQIKIKNTLIPILPIPEQERIVALLDETFAALTKVHANAERNQVNAREVFEAVLDEHVAGKESRKWEVKTVGEVSDHSLGKMLDKQKNRGNFQKYLRNINVRWFDFDLSDVNEMRFLEEEKEKYTVIKGDLLICEGGYPGRAAIWEEDYPIYFQKAIHRVRFYKTVKPKWFLYCLYAADLSGRLKKYLTGTGIQHFTGKALDRFEFPIPPLAEQRAIVQRLDGLAKETRRLEEVYRSKVEAVEELRKSVLGRAFAGEL